MSLRREQPPRRPPRIGGPPGRSQGSPVPRPQPYRHERRNPGHRRRLRLRSAALLRERRFGVRVIENGAQRVAGQGSEVADLLDRFEERRRSRRKGSERTSRSVLSRTMNSHASADQAGHRAASTLERSPRDESSSTEPVTIGPDAATIARANANSSVSPMSPAHRIETWPNSPKSAHLASIEISPTVNPSKCAAAA